jgi:hypothetical protein
MIAAKRRATEDDLTGWAEPDLVFVEVKSDYRACSGKSGLGVHARDYRDIITAHGGNRAQEIKTEYEHVVGQKVRLGLLGPSIGVRRFSPTVPELLVVFVDLEPDERILHAPLAEVRAVSNALGDAARMRFMRVDSSDYLMTAGAAVSPEKVVAEST